MKFSGMTPNILIIFILEKEGEDFALKTWYFNHKEPFNFFSAPKRHYEKSTLTNKRF
jgi:hypothetical protein